MDGNAMDKTLKGNGVPGTNPGPQPVRIASMMNGFIALDEDKLQQIVNGRDFGCSENSEEINRPLVILSVVGDSHSGKSFLLNLLLYYLRSGTDDGNWFNTLKNKRFSESGFYVKNISSHMETTDYKDGIYVWPQLLQFKDSNDTEYDVLLLDSHAENDLDRNAVEKLSCLLSSVLIDNQMTTFKSQLLQNYQDMKVFTSKKNFDIQRTIKINSQQQLPEVCRRFYFAIRDFEQNCELQCGKEDKGLKFIIKELTETAPALIPDFEHLANSGKCFLLKPPSEPGITVVNEKLEIDNQLGSQLKTMCQKIMDSLVPKNQLSGMEISEFFKTCAEIVNFYNQSLDDKSHISVDEDVEMEDLTPNELQKHNTSTDIPAVEKLPVSMPKTPLPLTFSKVAESEICKDHSWVPNSTMHVEHYNNPNFKTQSPEPNLESKSQSSCPSSAYFPSSLSKQSAQCIDEIVGKKIEALKSTYKLSMDQSSKDKAHMSTRHAKYLELALSEFRSFLLCKIQAEDERKLEELVAQLKKSLEVDFQMRKTKTQRNGIFNEPQPSPKPQAIDRSSTSEESGQMGAHDVKSKNFGVNEKTTAALQDAQRSELIEDNLINLDGDMKEPEKKEDVLKKKKSSIDQISSQDEEMDTEPSSECKYGPGSMDMMISVYCDEMEKLLPKCFEANFLVSEEDFMQSHKKTMDRSKIVNSSRKCGETTQSPNTIKFEHSQMIKLHSLIVETGILENYRTELQNENTKREFLMEKFLQLYDFQLRNRLMAWIQQVTNLKLKVNNRTIGKEFLNITLASTMNSFYYLKRNEADLLGKAVRESPSYDMWQTSLALLQSCFNSFKSDMEKQFEMNISFSEPNLNSTYQHAVDFALSKNKNEDQDVQSWIMFGLRNLMSQYSNRNDWIIQNEITAAKSLYPSLVAFHREMMTELTKGKFHMPDQLKQLHQMVVAETLEAFRKSCGFKPNQGMDSLLKINQLEEQFDTNFKGFENSNKLKAEKTSTAIKNFVADSRKSYNACMDKFLPSRGPHREDKELEQHHKESLEKACSYLEFKINKLEVQIPSADDVSSLRKNIQDDWNEIQKANAKLKQKSNDIAKKEREAEERQQKEKDKEKNKREANAKLEGLKKTESKKTESKKTEPKAVPRLVATNSSTNVSTTTTHFRKTKEELPTLPTIAIEFQLTQVRVGWMKNGCFEIINNNWLDEVTRTVLAFDPKGGILIGTETFDRPDLHASSKYDLFSAICPKPEKHSEFRPELLIALFLSRIKSDVEDQLSGTWTKVVITVPLCFTSVQRLTMKDAADLAGFESSQLINDTTAAAFYFFESQEHSTMIGKAVLVGVTQGVESHFDAALYELRQNGGSGLELLSRGGVGNLHSSQQDNHGIVSSLKAISKGLYQIVTGREGNPVRDLVKSLVGVNKDGITATVCITKEKSFAHMIHHHGRHNFANEDQDEYVIRGAAMFALNEGKTRVTDKASYTFQRTRRSPPGLVSIFDKYQILSANKVHQEDTIGVIPESREMKINICESSMDKQFEVGQLIVKTSAKESQSRKKPILKIRFALSKEGILSVEKVFQSTEGQEERCHLDIEWRSPNLDDLQRSLLKEELASMIKDERKEALENAKMILRTVVEDIEPNVDSIKSMIGRNTMKEEIAKAKAILLHHNSNQEQIESKLEILERLKSRYLNK